jgi:hypothetical protein
MRSIVLALVLSACAGSAPAPKIQGAPSESGVAGKTSLRRRRSG